MIPKAVVLDKSYLQGVSTEKLRRLATSTRLLMTEALFYELISNPVDMRSCFSKFPQTENPVDLVMHVGGFLRKEIYRRKPAPRPSDASLRFRFHPELRTGNYIPPDETQQSIQEQFAELQGDVDAMIRKAQLMPEMFPSAFSGNDNNRRIARKELESIIASDTDALLTFYGQLKTPKGERRLPPKKLLSNDWAIFRHLQVQLLFALDLACRQGHNLDKPLAPKLNMKIEHDVLDAQYMLVGALEGAFATREKKLQYWFALICPNGILLS